MFNSSRKIDIKSHPKYVLFDSLRKQCYQQNVTHSTVIGHNENHSSYKNDDLFCSRTFDGFACWDATPASATAVQPCPDIVIGFDPRRYAYKTCTENGTWYVHPEANKPWTNYTTCVDIEDLGFRNMVNNIYISGYSISLAALVLSLFIFFYFRALQCTRVRIHMHLFASFTFNNIMWILWYRTVVNQPDVVKDNRGWCQALHIITHYFMVSSYFWMFCEGLHLHISLVVVFVKDDVALRWFVVLGWGFSMLVVAVYSTVRYLTPGATIRCWMEDSETFWIIVFPVMISLIGSFVFLVNVVRVLLTKLHPQPNQRVIMATKKATRAALILIPLFGLHFVLIPLRPEPESPFENFYQVFSALITSLQGLCVAILFCFTNHDVLAVLRTQLLPRFFRTDDAVAMTGMSGFLL